MTAKKPLQIHPFLLDLASFCSLSCLFFLENRAPSGLSFALMNSFAAPVALIFLVFFPLDFLNLINFTRVLFDAWRR